MSIGDLARAGVHARRVVFNSIALSFLALVLFVALLQAVIALGPRNCSLQDATLLCQVARFIAG
jgi:hypothetical protein